MRRLSLPGAIHSDAAKLHHSCSCLECGSVFGFRRCAPPDVVRMRHWRNPPAGYGAFSRSHPKNYLILEGFMRIWIANAASSGCRLAKIVTAAVAMLTVGSLAAFAQGGEAGGEAGLKVPDLSTVQFVGGINGHKLLMAGILFCIFGLMFGLVIYTK